jgi:peptide/nickel transport system substrate-binding protein
LSRSWSTIPSLLPTAERIAQAWKAIGVPVNVTVSSTRPETFDAFLVYYDAPYDPDQYLLWHSTQKETNISHFSNPRIDNLLEEGRLEMNQDARKKIYLDFQRFLLEEAPAIFLYHPLTYTVSRQ